MNPTHPRIHLDTIARVVGTPCYVYDRSRIEANYKRLAKAFAPASLYYAVKANANIEILKTLRELGAGFDVVSWGETLAALKAGATPQRVVFAGVGKRDDELAAAVDAKIGWINVESSQELRALSDIAIAKDATQRVALRINPSIDPHTHAYLATGKSTSKFGIGVDETLQLIARRANYAGVRIEGLHMHIGSMVCEDAPYLEATRIMLDLVQQSRALGANITHLDLGGGFGVAYHAEQIAAPIESIASSILELTREANVELHFEPGRFVVADAGVLLSRVLYTKKNGDVNYAIIDAAMNDLIRPSLYGAKHEMSVVHTPSSVIRHYDIVGPICESGDFLGRQVELPELHRGDLLQIHHAGAYGMSMASNYNLRPRAAEVLIEGDSWRMIREREALDKVIG
jgi:diaminopimelate decarboxylase